MHVCVHVCIKTYIHTYTQAGTAPSIVLYVEEYNISLFLKKNCCGAVTCVTLHISTSHAVVNARGCWPTTTSSGPDILPNVGLSRRGKSLQALAGFFPAAALTMLLGWCRFLGVSLKVPAGV